MESSSGLILGMASASKSGQLAEEDGAVGDEIGRWHRVGENIGRASSVWVVAFEDVRSFTTCVD
jgi:hypothetical protein